MRLPRRHQEGPNSYALQLPECFAVAIPVPDLAFLELFAEHLSQFRDVNIPVHDVTFLINQNHGGYRKDSFLHGQSAVETAIFVQMGPMGLVLLEEILH